MKGNVLLLMDDRAGRTVAHRLGIPTMGLVGLLLSAKERGLLRNVGAAIEELRAAGYWLSDEVLEAARQLAGE